MNIVHAIANTAWKLIDLLSVWQNDEFAYSHMPFVLN